MKATIFNIERFAIHDGPGIRTTVFFKGCPLRCPWCANPESQMGQMQLKQLRNKCSACLRCVNSCPNEAIAFVEGKISIAREKCKRCGKCVENCLNNALSFVGEEIDTEKIYAEILKDKDFYKASGGGVTLSGGEVMLQWQAAVELLKRIKAAGIHTAIETCGDAPMEAYAGIAEYVDLFLFDIKHMDRDKLKSVIGGDLNRILQNLSYLAQQKKSNIIIRVPVIPQFNYEDDVIKRIFELAKKLEIREVHLLPYHTLGIHKYEQLGRDYQMSERGVTKEELSSYVRLGEQMGLNLGIGG